MMFAKNASHPAELFCCTFINLICTEYLSSNLHRCQETQQRHLTFFLLEGVRHDGICSGNQDAVSSLKFKAVSPVQEFRKWWGPLLHSQKSLCQRCQSLRSVNFLYLDFGKIQSTAKTQPASLSAPEFYFSGKEQDDPGCRVWLVPEPPSLWVAAKAGGMKLSSVQKGTDSVCGGGGAALVKPCVCHCAAGWECLWKGGRGSRAEVSQADWARFMLVEMVHRAISGSLSW